MSQPNPVTILSDEEDTETLEIPDSTPVTYNSKRQRTLFDFKSTAPVFVIDDDPTPRKSSASTPTIVPETPMSDIQNSGPVVVRCTKTVSDPKPSGITGLILLESDNESDNIHETGARKHHEMPQATYEVDTFPEFGYKCTESHFSLGNAAMSQMYGEKSSDVMNPEYDIPQACHHSVQELDQMQPLSNVLRTDCTSKGKVHDENDIDELNCKKRRTKEEKLRLVEEKRLQKEREKLQKEALKAEALEMKKVQKEKQKWEKGKLALKSIVAEIDTKVVEIGSVGGSLLSRFAEKGIAYRITSNPIERSIVWAMSVPEEISQLSPSGIEIPYILLVYEADEFCNLVMNESLMSHVSHVQSCYPAHTVCYLTNKLQSFINKREQGQYKDPSKFSGWKRPPVEEVLSRLTTHFSKVHSRQCLDEAELAEHVVGLTCSLASCQFRKKLTRLSVNANGSVVPKDCADKILIKKNLWLKALIAIPKVQPRFALQYGKSTLQ